MPCFGIGIIIQIRHIALHRPGRDSLGRSISFLHGSGAGGQVRTLRRTDGTVRIDTVRRAKGLTGTFRRTFRFAAVRRVAEFAVRRVKGAGTSPE